MDNEPEMLAALRLATGVLADIPTLELGRRFDAVLLMSQGGRRLRADARSKRANM